MIPPALEKAKTANSNSVSHKEMEKQLIRQPVSARRRKRLLRDKIANKLSLCTSSGALTMLKRFCSREPCNLEARDMAILQRCIELGSIFIAETDSPSCIPSMQNPFVVNAIFHCGSGEKRKSSSRVMLRVLFDTGADFNLVASQAQERLHEPTRTCRQVVRSLGDHIALLAETDLCWHFCQFTSEQRSQPTKYTTSFYVMSKDIQCNFDCIIGWPWIRENFAEVMTLIADSLMLREA